MYEVQHFAVPRKKNIITTGYLRGTATCRTSYYYLWLNDRPIKAS